MSLTTVLFPLQLAQTTPKQQPLFEADHQPGLLWLCIHLPDLALAVVNKANDHKPKAVFNETAGRCIVHTVSRAAAQAGVSPAMPLSAAYALCPALEVLAYDSQAESRQLIRLAKWTEQFTSIVSLEPPRSLLLEVRGSLRLFGGLPALIEKIREGLSNVWHHDFTLGVAPTPIASLLLASQAQQTNGQVIIVKQQQDLRSVLGKLPIDALMLDAKLLKCLSKIGAQRLRDLWRLPRDGLARRFGPAVLHYMDRALGTLADPRTPYQFATGYKIAVDLPLEVSNKSLILPTLENLITQLVAYLRERDAAIAGLRLCFYHQRKPPSELKIGLRYNSRDAAKLLHLVSEHLNRFELRAPVTGLSLSVKKLLPFTSRSDNLFTYPLTADDRQQTDPDWQNLLEQLHNRLGEQAIRGLTLLADHRPEHAWRMATLVTDNKQKTTPALTAHDNQSHQCGRPLWLLPIPQPLVAPHLSLVSGPERIEGGWWQGQDIRRDYYTAVDNRGRRLWLYRDLDDSDSANAESANRGNESGWYLHGLFA